MPAPLPTPNAAPEQPELPAPVAAAAVPKKRVGGFLSRRKPAADTAAMTTAAPDTKSPKGNVQGKTEATNMTVFGARDGDIVGGKPRFLGLILMAILLVFLAGVAAWATVFMEESLSSRLFPGRERTLASTLPDDARETLAQDVGATTEIGTDREGEQDGIVVAALNDSLSDDGLSAEDAAVLDALRDPLPDPVAPEELDAAALEARYAVTGIWPVAPDLPPAPAKLIDIEDIYVTGIDSVSPSLDAVALPSLSSLQTDNQLALVTSPIAAGTNFARDVNGRLIPTLEGALSPDGFTVFLGRPPAVPPATLARFETAPEAGPDLSALAQARPQPRPSDLVEQNERATLGGLSRNELAGLRPRLRPKAPQEIAQEVAQEAEPEEETPPAAVEPEQQEVAVATVLPTAPTLRPETRPRNFNRLVARAQRNAASAAAAAAPTRTASVAPRSIAPRSVTPSIPSSASVTRQATVRDAINLRKVNLIGVYGTTANRRALVRLSNGRYQKVEVGDRFDGGRVSAIGDSELRYQKGNRNLILTMPQG
ncbi:hypothetical protein [Tateyamaria sp.]